jgi:integrase
MLDNGCPLDVISYILGHDNLDVTAYYAQVSTRLMMKEYGEAASTRAELTIGGILQ